uniref:Uncharacterized protein n=1 Tax=Tanacetum cinerariifolium TaxID=118510 RepID=A0A699VKK6_TANCI|nr:hypothetical protein [Tanacetum cinerariifolium]
MKLIYSLLRMTQCRRALRTMKILPFFTYPVTSPVLLSSGSEDKIFDPGITVNRFYSFSPGLSHRCGTFKKFNTHRSHLNESPMEMLFSTCSPMDQ